LAEWEQFGKRRNKEEERKKRQNERKDLTLTGLLMEGLKPAGRGSLLTACGYTHIHGNLTGVCGLGGAFQQKEGEIGGQGLGTQPPNHRSDLATMIRGVVGQMLHEVR
jgi:hypothetical protein